MDVLRLLAGGLAVNRMAFGVRYALRPQSAGPSWIGRDARRPATQVLTRSQGVRDVALGGGALLSLARGDADEARRWMTGTALADATDMLATLAARDALPRRGAAVAIGASAVSTAIAVVAAVGLRP